MTLTQKIWASCKFSVTVWEAKSIYFGGTMKKSVATLASSFLVLLLLTGCASALESKNVSASLSAGDWENSLVGDEALVEATVELLDESSAEFSARLEVENSAGDWTTVAEKEGKGPNFAPKFALKLEEAGVFSYRISVYQGEKTLVTSSQPVALSVKDLKLEVRNLFYNASQACDVSESRCTDFIIKNNYPGLWDTSSPIYKEAIRIGRTTAGGTPDTDTLIETPDWLYTKDSCEPMKIDVSKPFPGRTYMVTSGGDDVHVTYLNGKFHFYFGFYFGC
jgi:hypothetical protein